MSSARSWFCSALIVSSCMVPAACGRSEVDAVDPAATVYIDPSVSSSGNGRLETPFRFWSEVTFASGKTYLQKRGTVAREQVIVNASGTAAEPIVIGAYGTGAAPILQGSETESGWDTAGGSVYQKSFPGLPANHGLGMVAQDGAVLTYHEWNSDVSTTFTSASAGSYSYDPATNTVYAWCTDGADPDIVHVMEVSRRYYGVRGWNVSHVRVENLHVRYTSLHGIVFENGTYIDVSGCTLEKLGGAVIAPGPIYAGNGIEFGNSSAHCTVSNCSISDIFDSGISPQTYSSNHHASDFVFSDSTVSRCGFAGVEIAVLYNGGMVNSDINGVVVRNVTVADSGKGWSGRRYGTEGRGIKINADLVGGDNSRSITGVVVEDCAVTGSAGEGIFVGGNAGMVTVRRCTVSGSGSSGVLAQEPLATTLLLDLYSSVIRDNGGATNEHGVSYNVPLGLGFRLRQNSIYNNEFIGFSVWTHAGEAVLVNNVFHAPAYKVHLLVNVDISAMASISNNCFTEFGTSQPIFNYMGATYDFAADFDTAYPAFAGGDIGTADPQLDATYLTLQGSSSPCYHTGNAGAGIAADRNGTAFNNPPSIGAFED